MPKPYSPRPTALDEAKRLRWWVLTLTVVDIAGIVWFWRVGAW